MSRIQVLAAMGITAIVLLVIARIWVTLTPIELMPFHWRASAAALGIGLGLSITVVSSVVYRLWAAYRASADFYLDLVLKPLVLPDLLWLGLLPGLSEELLFRGVMLPAFGLNAVGVIVSSICFGVMHYSGSQHWAYVVWATVIGVVLACSALATGNLLVPLVAHITTNLISSFLWKLSHGTAR
ncbi:CPBP family intramembrane metalloprotease [Oscillatoria sp. FACHB-1407]|nr:CPBP family intramembrane metalloprotease [Oscillatoria sp. FACHB-1407]